MADGGTRGTRGTSGGDVKSAIRPYVRRIQQNIDSTSPSLSSLYHSPIAAMSEASELSASYTSASGQKTFTTPLEPSAEANSSTTAKTTYLTDLRAKVNQLQDDVNAFLTQKMAEEQQTTKSAAETREEDMYGEEDPENDN